MPPPGHRPDGRSRASFVGAHRFGNRLSRSVPVGESPTGTGGSPVLHTSLRNSAWRQGRKLDDWRCCGFRWQIDANRTLRVRNWFVIIAQTNGDIRSAWGSRRRRSGLRLRCWLLLVVGHKRSRWFNAHELSHAGLIMSTAKADGRAWPAMAHEGGRADLPVSRPTHAAQAGLTPSGENVHLS